VTTNATLTRGSESVTIPIKDDAGTPLVSRSFGAPNHDIEVVGEPDPRQTFDNASRAETIAIETRLFDTTTILDLADLIKAHSGGTPITLDIPLDEYDDNILVAPSPGSQEAATFEYEPTANYAATTLTLARVDSIEGTDSAFRSDTPRASGQGTSGAGPVVLAGNGISVEFPRDITVERSVGRPNVNMLRSQGRTYPKLIDERKSSFEGISLSLTSISDAVTKVTNLRNMFRQFRGRDTITLNMNGLYGMGRFTVIAETGGEAVRHVRISGRRRATDQSVPKVDLRVVLDD